MLKSLNKFVSSETNPKFFFTMTEINKIGINPKSRYNTPLGIYSYPLTNEYLLKLINNKLPYAGEKPYINVFTISSPTFNLSNYNESNLNEDVRKCKILYKDKEFFSSQLNFAFKEADGTNPIDKFWNLTRVLSETSLKWNVLLRSLGYDNFYDPGTGRIHPSEPTQCVILDPKIIIRVDVFLNPYARKDNTNLGKMENADYNILMNHKDQTDLNLEKIQNYRPDIILKYLKFDKNKAYFITYLDKEDISKFLKNEDIFNILSDFCSKKSEVIVNNFLDACTNNLQRFLFIKDIAKNKNFDFYVWDKVIKYIDSLNDEYLLEKIKSLLPEELLSKIIKINNLIQSSSLPVYEAEHTPQSVNEKYIIYNNNHVLYFKGFKNHREDGPEVEGVNGYKAYWVNGKLHREDGPAIEDAYGNKEYFFNDNRHRTDGPAIEKVDGTKEYYVDGKLHREDGPAVEYPDGRKEYWVNNSQMSESDFNKIYMK